MALMGYCRNAKLVTTWRYQHLASKTFDNQFSLHSKEYFSEFSYASTASVAIAVKALVT